MRYRVRPERSRKTFGWSIQEQGLGSLGGEIVVDKVHRYADAQLFLVAFVVKKSGDVPLSVLLLRIRQRVSAHAAGHDFELPHFADGLHAPAERASLLIVVKPRAVWCLLHVALRNVLPRR